MKNIIASILAVSPVILGQTPADVDKQKFNQELNPVRTKIETALHGVISASVPSTFDFVAGELVGGSPVKGAPYSAQSVNETTQTLADGNRIKTSSSSTIYRDSAGRERREQSIANLGGWKAQGEPAQTIMISDPVAGVNYELNEKTRTARKMGSTFQTRVSVPTRPSAAGPEHVQVYTRSTTGVMITGTAGIASPTVFTSPGAGFSFSAAESGPLTPPKIEDLGMSVIEGVNAQGSRTTITIPVGQIGNERPIDIVDERWYSQELQTTVFSKHNDPRTGETTLKLTNINRTEPPASLFEVPPDYTVTTDGPMKIMLPKTKEE